MSVSSHTILSSLKDFGKCDEQLALSVKKTLLDPFQGGVDTRNRLSAQECKLRATQYASLATRLLNQNIQTLKKFKEWRKATDGDGDGNNSNINNNNTVKHCLIDTAFYAAAALHHMKPYTPTLKPLDIEKGTSNLICKLVDIGEWARALEELRRFRLHLASLINVPLDAPIRLSLVPRTRGTAAASVTVRASSPPGIASGSSSNNTSSRAAQKQGLRGSANQQQQQQQPQRRALGPSKASMASTTPQTGIATHRGPEITFVGGRPSTLTPNDEEMILKYADLFTFPLDAAANDHDIVQLVIACQLNVIRSWCDIHDGALVKYLAILLDRPGNFMDWCSQLATFDPVLAQKQFDSVQKLLSRIAGKCTTPDNPWQVFGIQALALRCAVSAGTAPVHSVCDRFVRLAVSYEKSCEKSSDPVNYDGLQKSCIDLLRVAQLNSDTPQELEAFFVFCEYVAFIARKVQNQDVMVDAYQAMLKPLDAIARGKTQYFHAANHVHAKLTLCTMQLERSSSDEDLVSVLAGITADIDEVRQLIASSRVVNDAYTEQAVFKLCKTLSTLRVAASKFWDAQQRKNSAASSPASLSSLASMDSVKDATESLTQLVERCKDLIPVHLKLIGSMGWIGNHRRTRSMLSPTDIMLTYVDMNALLGKMVFDVKDDRTHLKAFDYLTAAEDLCTANGFASGYRWIASAYYAFGAAMVTAGTLVPAAHPLRKACSLLEKDTARCETDPGRLQLAKRYEVLGTCLQKTGEFEKALKAFRLALKRVPHSSLVAFTANADTMTITRMAAHQPLVPKLMDRFLRSSVDDHEQGAFASAYLNTNDLNPVQQAAIKECELKIFRLLSHRFKLVKQQKSLIKGILDAYKPDKYPIRRARVLLIQVQLLHSQNAAKEANLKDALALVLEAQELLKSAKEYVDDHNLLNYRRHYLALSYSWYGILRREMNDTSIKPFHTALHHWGMLLKKVNSITSPTPTPKEDLEQVSGCIDDMDNLYDHFRVLADLFAVMGYDALRINVLRMMLKLNHELRDPQVDNISDSLMVLTDISAMYSDMGYTDKALHEFQHLQRLVSTSTCSSHAELYFMLQYSRALSTMGDLEKSKDAFNETRPIWDRLAISAQNTTSKSVRSYREHAIKHFMAADAYLARSMMSLYNESMDVAIRDATSCFQILSAYLKSNKVRRAEPPDADTFFSTDTSRRRSPDAHTELMASLASELTFKEYQWTLTMKLTTCMERLALLHMERGTWRDAQYFLTQGRQLAEKVKSNALIARFLILLADSYTQTGQFAKARSMLDLADDVVPKGVTHLQDESRFRTVVGDLDTKQAFIIEDALSSYNYVNDLYQKLMDPGYIASIERLVECDEEFERHVSMARDIQAMESTTQIDNLVLQQRHGLIMIKKALLLGDRMNRAAEGIALLEKYEENGQLPLKQNILNASIAHLRLLSVQKDVRGSAEWREILDKVLMLPSLRAPPAAPHQMLARRMGGASSSATTVIRPIREHLNHALERLAFTHRASAGLESVALVQQICLDLGCHLFLKSQVTSGGFAVNDHATLTSYYMDMAKGIGLRREMLTCLDQKLRLPQANAAQLAWPAELGDSNANDDENNSSTRRAVASSLFSGEMRSYFTTLQDLYRQEHDLDDTEFQAQFIDLLPPLWTVCSLSFDAKQEALYVAQYRAGQPPLIVKLPILRATLLRKQALGITGGGPTGLSYDDAINELQEIIQLSDDTIHSNKSTMTKAKIDDWWTTRSQLNTRLKKLLEAMEGAWLGGFKGMLCGHFQEHPALFDEYRQKVQSLLSKHCHKRTLDVPDLVLHMLLRLGITPTVEDTMDVVHFMLSSYRHSDMSSSQAAATIDQSPTAMERLAVGFIAAIKHYHEEALVRGIDTTQRVANAHVILVPDKHTHAFPLESLPIMRRQPVSRVPCLSFLRDRILYGHARARDQINDLRRRDQGHLHRDNALADDENDEMDTPDEWTDIAVNKSRTYYVLNPSGDLQHTETEFKDLFARFWLGLAGEKPTEMEVQQALKQHEIYIYFGHSAGQSLVRGQVIRQLPRCPVSILMGCSSGALQAQGDFDPHGYALNYLLGGSPAVVANLWDVTDKSIDRVAKRMMERWGLLPSSEPSTGCSLVEAVSKSRDDCPLPYLIGAATVVYGVPVYLNTS
ncbi:peptidase family C50-domain-containing protein [Gongronella butleri]|nr:peptidase family C50-domain-containing protein [Gongronella butleri]